MSATMSPTRHALLTSLLLLAACRGEVEVGSPERARPDLIAPVADMTGADLADEADVAPDLDSADIADMDEADQPRTYEPIVDRADLDAELAQISGADAVRYMSRVAPMLVGRTLTLAEIDALEAGSGLSIRPMLAAWVREPGFAQAARMFVQVKLGASGQRDGIDFELPGNLAHKLVSDDRPWSELVTAETCVDAAGAPMACDTGAPYTAGVLTTRAFLAGNVSRFNLRRASTLMRAFACRGYPMEATLQPPLNPAVLIPMFRAQTAEEQVVEEARAGFGNGLACYSCHSQFGAHAQLFVRYDEGGVWRGDATGLQDPNGELGRSDRGLFTSHMADPSEASSEDSQMFGRAVANLREAGLILASSDVFQTCMTRNLVEFGFGITETQAAKLNRVVIDEIVSLARATQADPTLGQLTTETFAHPSIVQIITGAQR
jgi:hypothetical protein